MGPRSIILILTLIIMILLVLLLLLLVTNSTPCAESPNHFTKQDPNDQPREITPDVLDKILPQIQKLKNRQDPILYFICIGKYIPSK